MQQLPTFNFGLTKIFFFFYRTLNMRQKTKNYRIKGSNAKNFFLFFYFPSQKTRAKNSHAWAPFTSDREPTVFSVFVIQTGKRGEQKLAVGQSNIFSE
jgi:hypothetical protein